jgi:hypothetical protein
MELVVFVGALALLAVASALWGEDSRDYERGSGLIAVAPRRSSRPAALPRAALAALASALGAALVRVGMALQRRAIAGA